jgi:molybdopterin-guanine dinucleotide biosynthesis protein A
MKKILVVSMVLTGLSFSSAFAAEKINKNDFMILNKTQQSLTATRGRLSGLKDSYDGHREKLLASIDTALAEINAAVEFAYAGNTPVPPPVMNKLPVATSNANTPVTQPQ